MPTVARGDCRELSQGEWPNTLAVCAVGGRLYAAHGGVIFCIEPASGAWRQICEDQFVPHFLCAVGETLYSLERSGRLYGIDATTGAWHEVAGRWGGTTAAVGHAGKLYTVDRGNLYATDPQTGKYAQLGDDYRTRFLFSVGEELLSIEEDGWAYSVSPHDGSWAQLPGDWRSTRAGVGHEGHVYTADGDGRLYDLDPRAMRWERLTETSGWETAHLAAIARSLYCFEESGNLYEVSLA